MSRAGISKALACLHPHAGWLGDRGSANPEPVIGALVFTFRSAPPAHADRDSDWMRWGTLLMLHSDLDAETLGRWMETDDAAPYSARSLRDLTYLRVHGEARRRHQAVHDAEMVLEARAMDLQADKIRGHRGYQIVRAARTDLVRAQDEDWPRCKGEVLGAIATGVLTEMQQDERCQDCGGAGVMPHVLDENRKPVPCRSCYGTTYTHWSDRQRARECDIVWSSWKRTWRRPYEWLYGQAMAARGDAVRQFRGQLR